MKMNAGKSRSSTLIAVLAAGWLLLAANFTLPGVQAGDQVIVSTTLGELPTTGSFRPGPISSSQALQPSRIGVAPVAIEIAAIDVTAEVEKNQVINSVMQDPTGPWVVSWYKESSRLGEGGNTVMAGHLDYWDVGPAIFYNIGDLAVGDEIRVAGDDGRVYIYTVTEGPVNYDVANAPIQEIVGPTDTPELTLITCGGPFDYQTGQYLQRIVVRASFSGVE